MDAWGRPTFEDGYNIARTAMAIGDYTSEKKEAAETKKTQENIYKVAGLLKKDANSDLSAFSDEEKFLGAQMKWQAQADELNTQLNQARMTTEGLNQEVARLQLYNQKLSQLGQLYRTARQSGNDAEAKKLGRQIFNMSPNGLHVKAGENGNLTITGWEGDVQDMPDLPITEYDNRIAALLDMDEQEKINMQLGNSGMIRERNYTLSQQAVPMIGPKNEVAYRIPAGTIDPQTGEILDSFYAGPDGNQIPDESVKGFKEMPEDLRNYFETAGKMPSESTRSAIALGSAGLTTSTSDTRSTMEKEAAFLMDAYGLTKSEAADMLRTDEQFGKLMSSYIADLQSKTAWLDPDEDKEEIAKIEKDLREKYNLDEYIAKRSEQKAEGGEGDNTGGEETETPPVEGAKKADDGKWYVQKDGKWYLVENK